MPVTVGGWWPACGHRRGLAIKGTLDDVNVVDLRMEVQSQPCIGGIATRPAFRADLNSRSYRQLEGGGGTAVDEQVDGGEVARAVGQQEGGGVGEFTGCGHPRYGHHVAQGGHLGVGGLILSAHGGGHHPRRDRAHPAALRSPHHRFAAGESLDPALGPGVGKGGVFDRWERLHELAGSAVGMTNCDAIEAKQTAAAPGRTSGLSASRTSAVPTRSTSMMALQSAMVGETPAAWARARNVPRLCTWALTAVSCSASATSATRVIALPSGRACAADLSCSTSRSTSTSTSAMSSSATEHPRPMPLAAPVTTATRGASSAMTLIAEWRRRGAADAGGPTGCPPTAGDSRGRA